MFSLEAAITSLEQSAGLPAVENIICILQSCRKKKNLQCAKRLHAYIRRNELEDHRAVGNYLVPLLVECGSLSGAQQVFNKLVHRNVYSWNSLIWGYVGHGDSQQAFHLYQKMQEDCVHPDSHTHVALLKASARLNDVERGREMYEETIKKGLERDPFVGSTAVDMFGKCGLLKEARQVFDKMPVRNVVLWNALIAVNVEHGLGQEALNCFEQMQLEDVSPDAVTFVCSLKACGCIKATEKGREIHARVFRMGLENDLLVCNSSVGMFSKCGSLAEAQEVFDKLPRRNIVSWNAMITGYTEYGLSEEAMNCFEQMELEGMSPNAVTFVCSLKACSSMGAIEKGRELRAKIARKGLERDLVVGTSLVDMFGKCGSLSEAHEVFAKMPIHNVVSWNALISGYTEHGLGKEAMNCFEQMQLEGISPNAVTFIWSLKACGTLGAIEKGRKIRAEIAKNGLERDLVVGTALVDMFCKCGSLAEAQEVFDKLPVRTAVSWGALIAGYAEHGYGEQALNYYEKMQLEGVSPNAVTFVFSLKACASIGAIERGREIRAEIAKRGLERDIFVGSTLLDMFVKCGSIVEAKEVFDKLPLQDVVSWNTMIKGYGENHDSNMAVRCFEDMQEQGIKPDAITFTCLLVACSHSSLVFEGQKLFKEMREEHEIEPSIGHYACMVDLLARSGHVYEAEKFVETMQCPPSKEIWIALLSACNVYGEVELGLRCFQHIVQMNPEDAPAYVLMSKIYASISRWDDANIIESSRKHRKAMKKPANALIETTSKLHEFMVGNNRSNGISEMLETLSSRMKDEGYVPNVDLTLMHISGEGNQNHVEDTHNIW